MKALKYLIAVVVVIAIVIAVGVFSLPGLNSYQKEGTLVLPGLNKPVKVVRDEKGMAYIYAEDMYDAIMAQGFVTAQDRLFQMQLTKLVAEGRISELAGEKAKGLDMRMRTVGVHRAAKKRAKILDEKTRLFFQKYADGVNAFIKTRPEDLHLEFKLAKIKAEPWTVVDSLAIAYYMGWTSGKNAGSEIITQMLLEKVGPERAKEIFSLNVNPDDPGEEPPKPGAANFGFERVDIASDRSVLSYCKDIPDGVGSNNWAVTPKLSPSNKPIVANDPHLDARILPGVFYPVGIITPKFRAVGVNVAGMPGMVVGRTDRVAMGLTYAYGDCQDLYVETLDPKDSGRYMEGTISIPFKVTEEKVKIRDKGSASGYREEKLKIRFTNRGPVISDLPGMTTKKVITARWSVFETMGPKTGLEDLLTVRSAKELRNAAKHIDFISLNMVYGDVDGNIGWTVTGRVPIRSQGDSTVPYVVKDGKDNWTGWISYDEMPHAANPKKGWVGTCNHKTVGKDYPYYFSTYFSPSYRYRRLKQLLDTPGPKSVDQHYQFQRDTVNLMAKKIAPVMARALSAHEDTRAMGKILAEWDFRDNTDKAAPTIFHLVYTNFARSVFEDELGADVAAAMLEKGFFWQERLQRMVLDGSSAWFDNVLTKDKKETRDDLFHQAALKAAKTLSASLGADPKQWLWGKAHQIQFVNPIRRSGFGKLLLGSGPHPMGGSPQTLYLARYDYYDPFDVTLLAAMRMVADLGDDDKVLAVLPGGVTGRTFDPHMKDQVEPYMRGDKVYWWLSDKAIKEHTKNTLLLNPK